MKLGFIMSSYDDVMTCCHGTSQQGMLPYVFTIAVLIFTCIRNKRENQPPASLGLSYFREVR